LIFRRKSIEADKYANQEIIIHAVHRADWHPVGMFGTAWWIPPPDSVDT
jgi:hypothetical protein